MNEKRKTLVESYLAELEAKWQHAEDEAEAAARADALVRRAKKAMRRPAIITPVSEGRRPGDFTVSGRKAK
jgi:hypothetical protein